MIRLLEFDSQTEPHLIFDIYSRLRDWNVKEIEAAFPGEKFPVLSAFWFHITTPAIRRIVFLDEMPIALAGCIPLADGRGRLYFIGTPEIEEHGVRIAALIRRFLPEAMDRYGIYRLECRALQGNPKTPRWFEALGGVFTRSEQDQFGTYCDIYEWSFDDVSRRRRRGRSGASGSPTEGGRASSAEPDSVGHVPSQPDLLAV